MFFKLQLVLSLEGLRSERQLMRLVADRLSVRWYLGYGLDEPLPDHFTLTRIRERYGLEVLHRFFEAIVQWYADAGLVWGKELYFDATKVQANASLDSLKPRFAVDEHLRNLFNHGSDEENSEPDDAPVAEEPLSAEPEPAQLRSDAPTGLAEENSSRHDWVAEVGRPERDVKRIPIVVLPTSGRARPIPTPPPCTPPMERSISATRIPTSPMSERSNGECPHEPARRRRVRPIMGTNPHRPLMDDAYPAGRRRSAAVVVAGEETLHPS